MKRQYPILEMDIEIKRRLKYVHSNRGKGSVVNMKCIKGYEVKVMKSPAGYYLGTEDPAGFPNCRISGYCQNKDLAPYLIPNRQTNCIENEYCNGGRGCGI